MMLAEMNPMLQLQLATHLPQYSLWGGMYPGSQSQG